MRQVGGFIVTFVVIVGSALADPPTFIRSVDVMKYTKDAMTSQPTDARITELVATLKGLNTDYIAIAIPLDASADCILIGVNYWGGWTGTAESIIEETPGRLELNARGRVLASFFEHMGSRAERK